PDRPPSQKEQVCGRAPRSFADRAAPLRRRIQSRGPARPRPCHDAMTKKTEKDELRDHMLSARVSEHEYDLVRTEAQRRRMNVTDFVRSTVLQEQPDATKTRLAEIETRLAEQDQTIFELATALTQLRWSMARGIRAVLLSNVE